MSQSKSRFRGTHLKLTGFGENFRFAEMEIDQLKVDHTYQRLETGLVNFIAENFDPLAFGCVFVGKRENGQHYIVDGQQRTAGAKKKGFKKVPVQVFDSTGVKQEARLFRFLNQFRKQVGPMDVFRAALKEGDETAVAINKAVTAAGFKIALRENAPQKSSWPFVRAIGQLSAMHCKDDGLIEATLGLIGKCWDDQFEALKAEALRGVSTFVYNFGVTLDEKRAVQRLKAEPMAAILQKAATYRARQKGRGTTVFQHQAVFEQVRKLYGKTVPSADKAHPPEEADE